MASAILAYKLSSRQVFAITYKKGLSRRIPPLVADLRRTSARLSSEIRLRLLLIASKWHWITAIDISHQSAQVTFHPRTVDKRGSNNHYFKAGLR